VPPLDSEAVYRVCVQKTSPAAAPSTCGRFQGAFNLSVLNLPRPQWWGEAPARLERLAEAVNPSANALLSYMVKCVENLLVLTAVL
jgi:hypothetical protein